MVVIKTLVFIAAGLFSSVLAAQTVYSPNWVMRADIQAVRKIYQEVNRIQLTQQRKQCKISGGAVAIVATLYLDKNKQVRKYQMEGGTGDSIAKVSHYYSISGKNRFTFEVLRAANGTHAERRLYFDAQGKKIYEDYKLLKGPGWAGGFDSELITNPKAHFSAICDAWKSSLVQFLGAFKRLF